MTMLVEILAFSVLVFAVLRAEESPGVDVLRPLMPAGCEAVCRSRSGCTGCRYIAADLSCRIHKTSLKREIEGEKTMDDTCHKGMTSLCEDPKKKQGDIKEIEAQIKAKMSRIIILPREHRNQSKVFNMNNSSIEDYPHLANRFVTGLAYLSRLEKLFVVMHHPYCQALTDVDFKNAEKIGEFGLKAESLAVDNTRMIVFIQHRFVHRHISIFDINNKSFRKLILLRHHAGNVAIDRPNQYIFVSCLSDGILKYMYNGTFISVFYKRMVGTSLYYKSDLNVLIFICKRNLSICIMDLKKGRKTSTKYVGFDFKILSVKKDVEYVNQCAGGVEGQLKSLYRNGRKKDSVNTNLDCSIVFCEIP